MSLGRGLGALITPTTRQIKHFATGGDNLSSEKVWQIPLTKISAGVDQPRKNFDPDELSELAESIKKHGVLQPVIVVEKSDGGYELIAGERRLRASQLAGFTTIPALIKSFAAQEKLEVALIENIQRANLNAIEEAFAFKRLIDEFGLTQQEVADKVGKSRPAVANSVRLLDLPAEAQTALIDGKINSGQARALLSLDTVDQQLKILSSMLGTHITVRELEQEVAEKRDPSKSRRDPNLMYLEKKLRDKFGTKVFITQKGEQGTIVISYHSKEELGEIIKNIGE
ncbi:MAG: ParB/RepB/Spo0J family partition protein [Candidatus Magasanikbacteria bacterium]|jgi:ParB family chromosome partitioning protein